MQPCNQTTSSHHIALLCQAGSRRPFPCTDQSDLGHLPFADAPHMRGRLDEKQQVIAVAVLGIYKGGSCPSFLSSLSASWQQVLRDVGPAPQEGSRRCCKGDGSLVDGGLHMSDMVRNGAEPCREQICPAGDMMTAQEQ